MKQLLDIEKVEKSQLDIFQWLCRICLFTIFCLFSGIVYLNTKNTSVQNSNWEFDLISVRKYSINIIRHATLSNLHWLYSERKIVMARVKSSANTTTFFIWCCKPDSRWWSRISWCCYNRASNRCLVQGLGKWRQRGFKYIRVTWGNCWRSWGLQV